jgi:hypothetical protein
MKLELLTNATVVDDAIRFVSDQSKYNKNIQGDEKQGEQETVEIAPTTRNQVF